MEGSGVRCGNSGLAVAVDLRTHFRRLGMVDSEARTVFAQPGVTLAELNAVARRHGLHFPVDPASADQATMGGIIANSSGGAHTVRYGVTRRRVESLQIVLHEGTFTTIYRGAPPDSPRLSGILKRLHRTVEANRDTIAARWPPVHHKSGYPLREYLESGDAVDLLVGSEGTLGMIVGATVRLAPAPGARGLALLEFRHFEAVGAAVPSVLELEPATCEMIDRTFIDLVRSAQSDPSYPLREGLEAILFVEMEGESDAEVAAKLELLRVAMVNLVDRFSLAVSAAAGTWPPAFAL